jgi:hypothetical protein
MNSGIALLEMKKQVCSKKPHILIDFDSYTYFSIGETYLVKTGL